MQTLALTHASAAAMTAKPAEQVPLSRDTRYPKIRGEVICELRGGTERYLFWNGAAYAFDHN